MTATPPTVYVIAGPNGAGKTTFASEFLPDFVDCREFLNADLIAAGLAPFAPETQNIRAARLLLERIKELAAAKSDFGFETTLSGRTYARLLKEMQEKHGYKIVLFFLWLPTADMAVSRVANRVRQGGHHVPEIDIRRRHVYWTTKPVSTLPSSRGRMVVVRRFKPATVVDRERRRWQLRGHPIRTI